LAMSVHGDRNNALNRAAFVLGTLSDWPEFDAAWARQALYTTARQIGLEESEIQQTIASGWEAGKAEPRSKPSQPGRNGRIPSGNLIIWAKDVKPRKVEWLWKRRIPRGKMTTFAGQTGVGKTFTICDIAARVSNGGEAPCGNGERFEQGKVLLISSEDEIDDTLVPRLMMLGADLSQIAFLSPESEEHFSLAALDLLNNIIDSMAGNVRLVAIDPPTSYLGNVDDHKNAELRGLLGPLKRWCSQQRSALIFNTHVNKAAGNVEAASRVIGSVAWVAAVRAAHMFCEDFEQQGRCLFVPLKSNVGQKPSAIAYRIKPVVDDLATLEWLEEVDVTADEAINAIKRKNRGVCAVEWLTAKFRECREWKSDVLKQDAEEAGISKNALWSPEVQALPIAKPKRFDIAGVPYYVWCAKEGWPAE
jgi:hypothetical protein